jgi:hypothetical protein
VISYRVRLDVPGIRSCSFPACWRPSPVGGDQEEHPPPGLLPAGGVRAGLVPRQGSVPQLGAGFGLSQATAYRYLDEVAGVLTEQAPGLREALERALAEGAPHVILDGTLISSDRCRQKTTGSRYKQETRAW